MHELQSKLLREGLNRGLEGSIIRLLKGDARRLDYSLSVSVLVTPPVLANQHSVACCIVRPNAKVVGPKP